MEAPAQKPEYDPSGFSTENKMLHLLIQMIEVVTS